MTTARSVSPELARLDPDRDYVRICQLSYGLVFPWEVRRALELATFHTFAVPSISELLDRTGEFAGRGQKRYDDTVALLREVATDGPTSPRGRAAIRHINRIHRRYDIGDGDFLYVLATFVVVPVRWIRRYGWRDLTDGEVRAAVNYYRELGRLMGLRHIPETYPGFARYLDAYERQRHSFSEANRRLAMAMTGIIEAWFPWPLRPLVRRCVAAALDDRLRRALGVPDPCWAIRAGVHVALRSRALLLRLLPPARSGRARSRRLRSYPHGYSLSDLGPRAPHEPAHRAAD